MYSLPTFATAAGRPEQPGSRKGTSSRAGGRARRAKAAADIHMGWVSSRSDEPPKLVHAPTARNRGLVDRAGYGNRPVRSGSFPVAAMWSMAHAAHSEANAAG